MKKLNKDYMLRTRLNPIEKTQMEMLILYYQHTLGSKVSKARLFGYLLSKEFDTIQMDIVQLVGNGDNDV